VTDKAQVWIRTRYGLEGRGFETWWDEFSLFHTGPEAHLATSTMDTVDLSRSKAGGTRH